MAHFECPVVRVKIEAHPNADAIEIARVGDFQSIVKKGQFRDGDFAVYIPEQAVLPRWLLEDMGFWDNLKEKGSLHGSLGNRVKAIKLRGVLSQGLVYSTRPYSETEVLVDSTPHEGNQGSGIVAIGSDAAACMGITKYEPALPSHMTARVLGVDYDNTHSYDFDNIKKKPTLFEDGEEIVITEKLHGTFMQVVLLPTSRMNDKYYRGRVIVTSKGMGKQGYVLDHNDETNLYAQAARKAGLLDSIIDTYSLGADMTEKPIIVMGEVFGKTLSGAAVQQGFAYSGEELAFRMFDVCIGNRGRESYMDWEDLQLASDLLKVPLVPVLYVGPYSKEVMLEHTDGKTTLGEGHIREGVVVKSAHETPHEHYGRKIAKSISEAYLLRKNGGDEYQ